MKSIVTRGIPRSLLALGALGAMSGLTSTADRREAQLPSGVSGQGYAALVTLPTGTQQLAGAALPAEGGMANADLDNAAVANTFTASTLTSITTGMADVAGASAQTTAEAADVNILNGLITARQVLAVAASYGDQQSAASEAGGSMLLGVVVNGVPLAADDATPAPNTRMDLPGVGYVVLNEQTVTGDGVSSSSMTVNMIHVYLQDALTGVTTGEIVVGSAQSAVAL
jgi:hypothetical protein